MRYRFENLQLLWEEDKEAFYLRVAQLYPVPSECELLKFEEEFPEVVDFIQEFYRIGNYQK